MNSINHHDFRSLKSESLKIDYIRWNLVPLNPDQIYKIASYFKSLGFNSYQKDRDNSKTRKEITFDRYNLYEVVFILNISYQEGSHLEFSGASAKKIYHFIKQEPLKWQKFLQHKPILRRIDICYDRKQKPTDRISNAGFIHYSLQQFQDSHPNRNLSFYKNQEGLLVKFGNRQSDRHYRVYTKKELLRFEFELKDKNKLHDYQILLQESKFEDFERILSYQFFKYSFEIFSSTLQPDHIDWLFHRLRPYQHRDSLDSLAFQQPIIYTHYVNQFDFQEFQKKTDFITLLQLLTFVRSLDFKEKTLTSNYRQFKFPLRDFLNYTNDGRSTNHYQLSQSKEFINALRKNTIIESFTDDSYRMLVTIPEVKLYKSNKHRNSWLVEIWIAEELFDYLCPFLYRDSFQEKLNKHQVAILFEILKVFCSETTRKEFNIQQFFESQAPNLNGTKQKQIKDYFIRLLNEFQQEGKIQPQVFFPLLNSQSNPKSTCKINQLTAQDLSQPLVVFEIVNLNFLSKIFMERC